jgi:hypothetical protein
MTCRVASRRERLTGAVAGLTFHVRYRILGGAA